MHYQLTLSLGLRVEASTKLFIWLLTKSTCFWFFGYGNFFFFFRRCRKRLLVSFHSFLSHIYVYMIHLFCFVLSFYFFFFSFFFFAHQIVNFFWRSFYYRAYLPTLRKKKRKKSDYFSVKKETKERVNSFLFNLLSLVIFSFNLLTTIFFFFVRNRDILCRWLLIFVYSCIL